MENPYDILGVSPKASLDEVKLAYRRMAMKYHPDRNNAPDATEQFKKINEAYEHIANPKPQGFSYGQQHASGGFEGVDPFSTLFSHIFGQGAQQVQTIAVPVKLSFAQAVQGGAFDIKARVPCLCEECMGTGAFEQELEMCHACAGQGYVSINLLGSRLQQACPRCQGQGGVPKKICGVCQGEGEILAEQTWSVTLPAMMTNGAQLDLGLSNGHHIVGVVEVERHPYYRQHQGKLVIDVPVRVSLLALGGYVDIPDIFGNLHKLSIPQGTQHQSVVVGRGLAGKTFKNKKLDAYVVVHAEIPVELSEEQKQLLKALDESLQRKPTKMWDKIKNAFS